MHWTTGIELRQEESTIFAVIDGQELSIPAGILFDRSQDTFDTQQIKWNFRFAYLIDGNGDPTRESLAQLINVFKPQPGLQLITPGRIYVRCTVDPEGGYRLHWGTSANDQSNDSPLSVAELEDVAEPMATLLNVGSFLRLMGHDELTPTAQQAVRQKPFRAMG
jgi:hypothetical protein